MKSFSNFNALTEAFNFRPTKKKEILDNSAIPEDWQAFIIDVWKMFGETVVFQTTGKLNKKGEVSGDALAGKIRGITIEPPSYFDTKHFTYRVGEEEPPYEDWSQ